MDHDRLARAQQSNRVTEFKDRPARTGKTDNKLETAGHITELAYYEAHSIANKVEIPPAVAKRIKVLEQAAKKVA